MRKTPILDTEPVWTQPLLTTPDLAELVGITEAAMTKRIQKSGFPEPAEVDGRRRLWSYAQVLTLFTDLGDIELVATVTEAIHRRDAQLAARVDALQATIQTDLDEIETERAALTAFGELLAPLNQLLAQLAEGAAALRSEITDYTGAGADSEAGAA
ncbi:hypothetical protein GYA93_12595 [Gordonia desulfuricans]|uniref:Uncharacterized protein n=1 Tax=Gordonia desulfuricans TaxID=89051 RepID=A0A7K3LQD8_9ACTN|nr:hypothetical protein [Gordonia desulfuricans]NDK90410.1 hypothetical protein [Gordonia desulfuricans]